MARKRKSTDRSKATNTGGDGGGGIGNGKSEVLKIGKNFFFPSLHIPFFLADLEGGAWGRV